MPLETDVSKPRRFAIGDWMIVIIYMALLSAWFSNSVVFARISMYVSHLPEVVRYLYFEGPIPKLFPNSSTPAIREYFWNTPRTIVSELFLPAVILYTPIPLLFRLRKPRPGWTIMLRQPGTIACLAILISILVLVDLQWMGGPFPSHPLSWIAGSVAACWAILLVTHLGRRDSGWIDRSGRAVGLAWIILAVVAAVQD